MKGLYIFLLGLRRNKFLGKRGNVIVSYDLPRSEYVFWYKKPVTSGILELDRYKKRSVAEFKFNVLLKEGSSTC